MKGFKNRPSKTVTLNRGGESIELTMHAIPTGFQALLRTQMKPRTKFVNGKPAPAGDDENLNDLFGLLLIAKSLEPSGVIDTPLRAPWVKAAESVRSEFREANLTDGDLGLLVGVLGDLTTDGEIKEIQGN